MKSSPEELAGRYVAWLRRHVVAVIAAHAVVLALAGYLIAFHLPLFADFSYLLPQDAPAVTDLRRLEKRIKATDTMLVVVQAPTSDARAAAVRELAHAFRGFPKDLVGEVEADDVEIRAFLRDNKFLFVPLGDLQKARDALAKRVAAAKLAANPLYVDLDSDDSKADAAATQIDLDELKQQRKDAEAKLDRSSHVSPDGKTAMIEVRIAFRTTDIDRGHQLIARLDAVRRQVAAEQPGVVVGFTGSIITAVSEHAAIFNGIVLSSIITALLVAMVLALYFRSARLLVLLVVTIAIATAAAFGAAALTVGHLNAATAFLGAIIAGNGVNYGILLIARFLEERRARDVEDALAFAIVGTLRPTAVASLGASIAYGSLAATSFKGFADFAVIGAIGMILCWIASYALLPALVLVFGRRVRVRPQDPWLGHVLVRLLGFESSKLVVACGAVLLVGAGVVVSRYVAADPFEYDMKQLRSEGAEAAESRHWMKVSDDNFGRGYAGRTFIAADRPEQIPQIIAALRARDAGKPPSQQVIGSISSILDAIPPEQEAKLELLGEIRTMLDKNLDALDGRDPAGSNAEGRCGRDDEKDRADLADLRPPDYLRAITRESLPKEIRDKPEVTEADGRIGLMLSIHSANRIDEWNGHDLIEFSSAVRRLDLADGETVTTSGASVIFADIIAAIEHDGPIVTAVAAIGIVVMVLGLVGWNRRAGAVLVATIAGALFMVALCALLDLKVNFLDFIALPITLGIGIDYAINVAHRYLHADTPDVATTLRTSGSAVFVCSMTTMIGYGSLLVSDNLAIRGFGAASLLGEVTCVLTALVLVPALLGLGRRRDSVPIAVARGRAATRYRLRRQPGGAACSPSIFSTAVDFATLTGLVELAGVDYVLATFIGTIVGFLTNFTINRYWAFEAMHGHLGWQFARVLPVQAGSTALQTLGVWVFDRFIGFRYWVAKIIVAVLVYLIWNYPMNRFWVFFARRSPSYTDDAPVLALVLAHSPAPPPRIRWSCRSARRSNAPRSRRRSRARNREHWITVEVDARGFVNHVITDDPNLVPSLAWTPGDMDRIRSFLRGNIDLTGIGPRVIADLEPNGMMIFGRRGARLATISLERNTDPGQPPTLEIRSMFEIAGTPVIDRDAVTAALVGTTVGELAEYGTDHTMFSRRRTITLRADDIHTRSIVHADGDRVRVLFCSEPKLAAQPPDPGWGDIALVAQHFEPSVLRVVDAITGERVTPPAKTCDELANVRD